MYFCSLGTECHVALKVDTGTGQYAADNGAFIRGHVTTLASFRKRVEKAPGWRQLGEDEAQALLLRERFSTQ